VHCFALDSPARAHRVSGRGPVVEYDHAEVSVMKLNALSVMVFAMLLCAGSFVAAGETLIAEHRGNGTTNTRPFDVEDGWELRWDSRGDVFQVYLHDANGDFIDVAANELGRSVAASYFPRGGRYYLSVNAIGSWSTQIVHVGTEPRPIGSGLEFRGGGTLNTRPFVVEGPWEIEWESEADILQVFILNARGDFVDLAANQMGPDSGASYQPRGGTYFLQMNAIGPWTIRVARVN
jgi:hypothetical protein